ncbi:MAG: VCBS repeat-containing protein [Planctomycetota bacterium]
MRRVPALAAFLLLAAIAAAQTPSASLAPDRAIVAALLHDTDGDGRVELLLVDANGTVARHGVTAGGLVARGTLALPDPQRSLFAFADLMPTPGTELVVADGNGTTAWTWPAEAAPQPVPLLRRARSTLPLGAPQRSPFVQDLDRDGRLDVLLPTLQGVQPFRQEAPADDGTPAFRALPTIAVRVRTQVQDADGRGDRERTGELVVPPVDTEDLDGDGKPDLLTREGQVHRFHLQTADGSFGPPIELDLARFEDSTPKATMELGATAVLGDRQLLQRGDVNGDGMPDYVIAHRRKVWTFVTSKQGPQFEKARTQATADDVTAMLLVDLDEDRRADLLTFQVQLPGVGALLLGLVQSIDIDVKAVGHTSEGNGFANQATWRRTVTLRIPPLLSLLGRQEELVQRFTDILGKARLGVRGAFAGSDAADLLLVTGDGKGLEVFADAGPAPTLDGARGRRLLRELLFEDPDPLFDLERLFKLVSGLFDELSSGLVADAKRGATLPLRDPAQWRLVELLSGPLDDVAGDDVIAVYEAVPADGAAPSGPPRREYELVVLPR